MIHSRALDKIARHLDTRSRSTRAPTGGKRLKELCPHYYTPSMLSDATGSLQELRGNLWFDRTAVPRCASCARRHGRAVEELQQTVKRTIWQTTATRQSEL